MKKTSTVQTFSNEIFKEQGDAHFSGGPVFGYSIRLNPIPLVKVACSVSESDG
jgi:hypothetical protein